MSKRPSDLVIALSKGGAEGEEWEGSDRESIAEALADSGALVVQNLNKGVDVLVASSAKDESSSVQKAKKLKISIANTSVVKAIQKAGEEDGTVDIKPHLVFEGDNKKGKDEDKSEEEEEEESEDEEEEAKPKENPFPHPFYVGDMDDGEPPFLLAELALKSLSRSIRLKPDWETKMNDKTIVQKWEKEALSQGITAPGFKFVMDELKWIRSQKEGAIEISTVDGTWQADGHIDKRVKEALLKAVAKLEDVPDKDKDWHPGSNNQVLDLVHPSLFPLVFGFTKELAKEVSKDPKAQLKSIGSGTVVAAEKPKVQDYSVSTKFQWLPSEFRVRKSGKVKIQSYINNLHPEWNKEMYPVLEKIFEKFVPMFEKVLTRLREPVPPCMPAYDWYKEEDEDDDDDGDDDDDDEKRAARWIEPTIPDFAPPSPAKYVNLKGRRLQVIVKLANILLTPANPSYPGGVWHVEGMFNESIVASGIYYYVSENITESRLEFRSAVAEPPYEQCDYYGVRRAYNLENEGPLNQTRGYILTQEDRCICFPNLLQHKVAPFQLTNKNKPGVRKILVYFLVDPTERIRSTATIPPQQEHWMFSSLQTSSSSSSSSSSKGNLLGKLPDELLEKIVGNLSLMSWDEAKKHREELMKERKYFVEENSKQAFEREFSLCEH